MTTAAIVTTILIWLVFICGLGFCLSRVGKGGTWQD